MCRRGKAVVVGIHCGDGPLADVVAIVHHPPAGIGNGLERAIEVVGVVELLVFAGGAALVVLKIKLFPPHQVIAVNRACAAIASTIGLAQYQSPNRVVHGCPPH